MPTKKTSPLRYAFGMFGTSIPINMFKAYAIAFYVDKLSAITLEQFSLITLIYTFIDAIDNPVYGILSDRTRSRFGRRRTWLCIGTPLLVLAFIAFYNPPAFVMGSPFLYILLTYILTGTLDSLINANYGALFPELFPDEKVRAKTNAIRQVFQLVAMVISLALTGMVVEWLGYGLTSIVYALLAGVVILFMALGCHEQEIPEEQEKPSLIPALIALLTNSKFWLFGLTNAFYSACMSLVIATVTLFVKHSLGLGGASTTILQASVIVCAAVSIGVWSPFVKKVGLMKLWRIGLFCLMLSFIPLYFANGLVMSVICCVVLGIAYGGVLTTMDLVGTRVLDEDYRRHGVKREGIVNSVMGFMNRLNGLFVSLATFLASRVYGYVDGANPGTDPGGAGRFMMCLFPLGCMVVAVIISQTVKFPELDEKNG